jgi:hypothetical protein
VHDNGPADWYEVAKDALRLSERVREHNRTYTSGGVLFPPRVQLTEHTLLRLPLKDRQPEGAFRDEDVTPQRFKRRTHSIIFYLVVTAKHPTLPGVFNQDLRGARNMTSGVK